MRINNNFTHISYSLIAGLISTFLSAYFHGLQIGVFNRTTEPYDSVYGFPLVFFYHAECDPKAVCVAMVQPFVFSFWFLVIDLVFWVIVWYLLFYIIKRSKKLK